VLPRLLPRALGRPLLTVAAFRFFSEHFDDFFPLTRDFNFCQQTRALSASRVFSRSAGLAVVLWTSYMPLRVGVFPPFAHYLFLPLGFVRR